MKQRAKTPCPKREKFVHAWALWVYKAKSRATPQLLCCREDRRFVASRITVKVRGMANIDCSIRGDRCAWFSRLSSGSGPTCCQYDSLRFRAFIRRSELMKVFAHSSVLDEITTHIDSPTLQALGRALRSYPGSLVLVTHDR